MLHIIKKINTNSIILLIFVLSLNACKEKGDINAIVYKEGKSIESFYGILYTTKYGGINYFIGDDLERNRLFNIENIDSVVVIINDKKYISKPLELKSFSRERNNSDFSFDIDKKNHKIIPDLIENMNTLLLYSEKTNIEKLKDSSVIKCVFLEESIDKE